jgi:hypothetical protein
VQSLQIAPMLYAWTKTLKELKKQYEQKSKEVLKDIGALGEVREQGRHGERRMDEKAYPKGAVDATALLRQVGTLLPPPK